MPSTSLLEAQGMDQVVEQARGGLNTDLLGAQAEDSMGVQVTDLMDDPMGAHITNLVGPQFVELVIDPVGTQVIDLVGGPIC